LPRPYSDGLREHVYRDGFVADFDLPIAAQTKQVFQGFPSWRTLPARTEIVSLSLLRCKYAEGFPENCEASALSFQSTQNGMECKIQIHFEAGFVRTENCELKAVRGCRRQEYGV
jgi:hypothetical protein